MKLEDVQRLFEVCEKKALDNVKMPETFECDCKIDLTYDKENDTCQKCVMAHNTKDSMLRKAAETGNMDLFLQLMLM